MTESQPNPVLQRAVGSAGPSESPAEDDPALLQGRVTLYFKVITLISAAFFVAFALLVRANLTWREILLDPSRLQHAVFTVVIALVWYYVSSDNRSPRVLHALEGTGTVLMCTVIASMALYTPFELAPGMIGVAGNMFVLVLRGALVPSTPKRTVVIGLLSFLPLALVIPYRIAGEPLDLQPEVRLALMVRPSLWGGAAVAVSAVISHVIYGLHARVRRAMQLGQYTLTRKIGEGGMGAVYEGTHVMLRRPTAVKLLPTDKVGAQSVARFEREVRETSRLSHPNTVAIYDYGRTPEGVFYYAMEYLDGVTLEELVKADGPQPSGRVIHILRQSANALSEAHTMGLVHRDIKPANIMLTCRIGLPDHAKVLDFGLVKDVSSNSTDLSLTQTDTLVGTPYYLAPEAITRPDTIDARADLYALGGVGYFLLTGTTVFGGKSVAEVCAHHLYTEPELPSKRSGRPVDPELERLIMACLTKDPEGRIQSASELADALGHCADLNHWTPSKAQHWWKEWTQRRPPLVTEPDGQALSIDLDRRNPTVN